MTRPLRIAVGQIWQETNTFNRNASTLEAKESLGSADIDRVGKGLSQRLP